MKLLILEELFGLVTSLALFFLLTSSSVLHADITAGTLFIVVYGFALFVFGISHQQIALRLVAFDCIIAGAFLSAVAFVGSQKPHEQSLAALLTMLPLSVSLVCIAVILSESKNFSLQNKIPFPHIIISLAVLLLMLIIPPLTVIL